MQIEREIIATFSVIGNKESCKLCGRFLLLTAGKCVISKNVCGNNLLATVFQLIANQVPSLKLNLPAR